MDNKKAEIRNSVIQAIKNLKSINPNVAMVMILISLAYGCGNGNGQIEQPAHYPQEGTPEATLYIAKCGQCHAAPLPSAHTPSMWPSVLDRMQVNIKTHNVAPVSRKEMSIILGYLQQNAKKPTSQQTTGQQSGGAH